MDSRAVSTTECPHCSESVAPEPELLGWWPPFVCSHCHGLYGYGSGHTYAINADFQPLANLMDYQQARRWAQFNAKGAYVYAICYPNGIPFYFGKGLAMRLLQHAHEATTGSRSTTTGSQSEKLATINALCDLGIGERYAILATECTNDEAFRIESELITHYGLRDRCGMLTNRIGDTSTAVPYWSLPIQPALHENGESTGVPWICHVDFVAGRRKRGHKGLLVTCDRCQGRCMHPATPMLYGARCPFCCHPLGLDPEEVREFWAAQRPSKNATSCYP